MESNSQYKVKACQLAQRLLESNEDYLDNVIDLWQTGSKIYDHEGWDTEFHVFGVISSDTDHLPTKNVRQHCSKEMLEKSDVEITHAISFYKSEVTKACNEIIKKFKNT